MGPPILLRRTVILALFCGAPAAGRAAPEKKKGGGETFIQLPTLAAGLYKPSGGSKGVLTVDIGLDVPDAKLRAQAMSYRPILQDAYTRYVLSYAASLRPGAPPSPDAIGKDLQRITDDTLKRPGAILLLGTILIN